MKQRFAVLLNSIFVFALWLPILFSGCSDSHSSHSFEQPAYLLLKNQAFDLRDVSAGNKFEMFPLGDKMLVKIDEIELESVSMLGDELKESQIQDELDLRFLRAMTGSISEHLANFKTLRDELIAKGDTTISINFESFVDVMSFSNGRLNGLYKRYSKEKELVMSGQYTKGVQDWTWSFYKDGRLSARKYFSDGELNKVETIARGKISSRQILETRDQLRRGTIIGYIVFGTLILGGTILLVRHLRKRNKQKSVD